MLKTLTRRKHALLTGRAAAGLVALLRALDFTGRTILIPANTCYIILWAVLEAGCRPALVDIAPQTGNINLEGLAQHDAREDTAALLLTHMYGLGAPASQIVQWAAEREIIVIEDAALALGATVDDRPAGSWGTASLVSFGMGKIVSHGNGGALLLDDHDLAARCAAELARMPLWDDRLRDLANGWNALYWALHQYEERHAGLADLYGRLFDLYRGIAAYQLPSTAWDGLPPLLERLLTDRQRRMQQAAIYDQAFAGLPVYPLPRRSERDTLWNYPLLVPCEIRDDLLAELWSRGFHEVARWYPSLQTMCRALGYPQANTPHADRFAEQIVTLPLGGSLTQRAQKSLAQALQEILHDLL